MATVNAGVPTGTGSIASGFTDSGEFSAKYGSLTDTQFVTQLYANILDRAPDAAGLASWISSLTSHEAAGMTQDAARQIVLVGIADSQEAINNATQGYTGQSGPHAAWLVLI